MIPVSGVENQLVSGEEEAEQEDDAALGEHHHVQLGHQQRHTRYNVEVQKQLKNNSCIFDDFLEG